MKIKNLYKYPRIGTFSSLYLNILSFEDEYMGVKIQRIDYSKLLIFALSILRLELLPMKENKKADRIYFAK